MSTGRFLLVSLLAFGLLGCQRTPPPPTVGANNIVITGPPAVSFLIDYGTDNDFAVLSGTPTPKLTALQDCDVGGGIVHEEFDRGGQAYSYRRTWIPGIKDVEAAAGKIDFGLVVAVDPVLRIVVVDLLAKPAPRPAEGWPGAKAVDQFVVRKTAMFAARQAHADLVKKFGRDKVVVVFLADQPGSAPADSPILQKLRRIAPETLTTPIPQFGPKWIGVTLATVAPVQDLGDVVTALEGAAVLAVDHERRVVLLGDVADLKP